jgi:hypothetical protein
VLVFQRPKTYEFREVLEPRGLAVGLNIASILPRSQDPFLHQLLRDATSFRAFSVISKGIHDGNHAVLLKLFSLISSLSQQEGGERFVDIAISGSNNRRAYIYRSDDALNDRRPPRHVANYGRSWPMPDARVRLRKSRPLGPA